MALGGKASFRELKIIYAMAVVLVIYQTKVARRPTRVKVKKKKNHRHHHPNPNRKQVAAEEQALGALPRLAAFNA
jgi:hypothetical protein